MERIILVTYDIPDDKRRNKVSNQLKNFGERVQYSVFECLLNDKHYHILMERLHQIIDEKEDSIRFYRLCKSCENMIEIQGLGEVVEGKDYWII